MSESKTFSDESQIIKELNSHHAAVMVGGRFAILSETINPATDLPEIQFSTVGDIRNLYRNQKIEKLVNDKIKLVNPADIWLDHTDRRQFKGIVFTPDEPLEGYYNLWRGFALDPQKGDCQLFLDHLLENICSGNIDHFNWLVDWMADAIQNPADRPGTAIVLRGVQGTGKGVFVTQFGTIFGSHFVHISGQHRLTGKFNNHLKMGLIVFVDEGFFAGDRRDAGMLKAMITEKTLLIEQKYVDAIPLRNHLRVIMASNSDWVVPADLEERRFCVLDVSDKRRMDTAYFGAIIDQMNSGGRAALLYDLLNRKIKSNLREIPRTQALFDQMINSMDSFDKWWLKCLQTGKITINDIDWPQCILPQDVHDCYVDHCHRERERHPVTFHAFFRRLNKICPGYRLRKMNQGSGRENYSCFPYLEVCRQFFVDKIGITVDWTDDEVPF